MGGRRHLPPRPSSGGGSLPGGLTSGPAAALALSYVLPLRRWHPADDDELDAYLGWLSEHVEVLVVDGSAPELFAAHHRRWQGTVRHVPVDADLTGRYGKVNGVITGVRAASHERVLLADDDVRWTRQDLDRVASLLDHADLVCPQNYFEPLPWHARWDTARTLVNRAAGIDYPGTLAVRRSTFLRAGGYDGDVLFENLELIRTIRAVGGRAASAPDLHVRRLPSSARHFWSQRIRQAYDDLALPVRLLGELAVVPLVVSETARGRARTLAVGAAGIAAAAEVGRRRHGGTAVFPATCSLLAPVWLLERGVCIWAALTLRVLRGGVPYAGTVLRTSAHRERTLRRRLAAEPPAVSRRGAARRRGWAAR
ncbi:MAG: glycosyltransferase family 2 protein [Actinomycetota bacterium]|nr:glycosyltransferase family 2 protein [Actinomycetota bacterium]